MQLPQSGNCKVSKTIKFCERANISIDEINQLSVIHVAGTKGKGSTSSYIEAILRSKGYNTGLFTSPHLNEVRERIQINGNPISRERFCESFWPVYENLVSKQNYEGDLPFYFQFLTVMALHVFLQEKVDYVVLETGIGGRFDSTNIIACPKLSVITSIGYDHMEILGNTLQDIAWNKAGIIKKGGTALVCSNMAPEAMQVIKNTTDEQKAKLFLIPMATTDLAVANQEGGPYVHPENAALAVAACVLLLHNPPSFSCSGDHQAPSDDSTENRVVLPTNWKQGYEHFDRVIQSTFVRGRYQQMERSGVYYFIDGAHTVESIRVAAQWFKHCQADNHRIEPEIKRYLIFMITGRRSASDLLAELADLRFNRLLLCPLIPSKSNASPDFASDPESLSRDYNKMTEVESAWRTIGQNQCKHDQSESVLTFDCFSELHNWLVKQNSSGCHTQALVLGSLHLVGCALAVLENINQ